MVLGKLPVPGRPTIWMVVGQGPTALAVGAGGGCSDIFILLYLFSPLSPSLWETARYRLKYCLKGPLNQKQPTNQFLFVSRDEEIHQKWGLSLKIKLLRDTKVASLDSVCVHFKSIQIFAGVVVWCDGAG